MVVNSILKKLSVRGLDVTCMLQRQLVRLFCWIALLLVSCGRTDIHQTKPFFPTAYQLASLSFPADGVYLKAVGTSRVLSFLCAPDGEPVERLAYDLGERPDRLLPGQPPYDLDRALGRVFLYGAPEDPVRTVALPLEGGVEPAQHAMQVLPDGQTAVYADGNALDRVVVYDLSAEQPLHVVSPTDLAPEGDAKCLGIQAVGTDWFAVQTLRDPNRTATSVFDARSFDRLFSLDGVWAATRLAYDSFLLVPVEQPVLGPEATGETLRIVQQDGDGWRTLDTGLPVRVAAASPSGERVAVCQVGRDCTVTVYAWDGQALTERWRASLPLDEIQAEYGACQIWTTDAETVYLLDPMHQFFCVPAQP